MKKELILTKSLILLIYFSLYGSLRSAEIPEFYGTYLVEGGKLITLKKSRVVFKQPSGRCAYFEYMSGADNLGDLNIHDKDCQIILYEQSLNLERVKLTKLQFINVAEFNCAGMTFRTTKVNTKVNLWIAEKDIPFKVSPVKNKSGMYRIVPENSLEPGPYAIHKGCFWHKKTGSGSEMMMLAQNYGMDAFLFSVDLDSYEPTVPIPSESAVSIPIVSESDFPDVEGKSAHELLAIGKYLKENGLPYIRYFEKASQIEPNWSQPYYFLGLGYYKDENNDVKAEECLKRFLELEPSSDRAEVAKKIIEQIKKISKKDKEEVRVQKYEVASKEIKKSETVPITKKQELLARNRLESLKQTWTQLDEATLRAHSLIQRLIDLANLDLKENVKLIGDLDDEMSLYKIAKSPRMKSSMNQQMASDVQSLLAIIEANPNLKNNKEIRDVRIQLEGAENRITAEKLKYLELCRELDEIISSSQDKMAITPVVGEYQNYKISVPERHQTGQASDIPINSCPN